MADKQMDVLAAVYTDVSAAQKDFEGLVELVKNKKVKVEGVILVTKDAEGNITVANTGDHLGRKGAGWGGGVGVVVGLFAPALLPAVAVGAAAGAIAGKFAGHKLREGIHDKLGENLPAGSAAVIAMFSDDQRLAIEQALPNSPAKSIAQADEGGIRQLKTSLTEAMGKFAPDRTVLPLPDLPFGGTAGRTIADSVADWTVVMTPKPPEGAPNVLVVLIDDAGFGNPATFGGPIKSDAMSRVAEMGLTYNRFHVTAICSPTRSALLTGRNQHRVGFGSIAEYPGPFPGYTAALPKSCAPVARVLKDNGYVTGGFGKWHLTPDNVQGAAGPFDRWPSGWGFDHWWGFLSGAAGQYDPIITQGNDVVGVPEGKDGKQYYFPDDITDKAVEWLHAVRAQSADKPWFMYYSTGCAHAPHHVATEWADKYKGKFDSGWDAYREMTFARQKELGVVPQDAELTPRPDLFPAWDSLSDADKKLYARQMEVFAGYSENADWNVGRLLDSIEETGDLDNTLILYIWGDNGASMEGTITGSFNEMTFLNGVPLTPEQQLELIDRYGGIEGLGGVDSAPTMRAHGRGQATARSSGASRPAATWAAREIPWWSRGPSASKSAASARNSRTASTWVRPSSRPRASPSPSLWTASSRSRWTAPASSTRSTTRTPKSATPCSTSSPWAAAPSTRTAGGRAPDSTGYPGTSHRRPSRSSRRVSTTPRTTDGSSTTSPMTSPRRTTSPPSSPRSSPS